MTPSPQPVTPRPVLKPGPKPSTQLTPQQNTVIGWAFAYSVAAILVGAGFGIGGILLALAMWVCRLFGWDIP